MYDKKIIQTICEVGHFLRTRGDYDSAIRIFEALLRFHRDRSYACFGLALTYAEKNNFELAKNFLNEIIEIYPSHSMALACKGLILVSLGQGDGGDLFKAAASSKDDFGGQDFAKKLLDFVETKQIGKPQSGASPGSSLERLNRVMSKKYGASNDRN